MSEAADRIMQERGEQWGPILENAKLPDALLACAIMCWVKAERLKAVILRNPPYTDGTLHYYEGDVELALDCLRDLQNYAAIAEKRLGEVGA